MISSKEIKLKFTGFSTAIFGSSLDFSETEKTVIQNLFIKLEDKRVLYAPYELESVVGTIRSVNLIRDDLNSSLERLGINAIDQTIRSIKDMRRACRKYLDVAERIIRPNADDKYVFFHNLSFTDQVKCLNCPRRP